MKAFFLTISLLVSTLTTNKEYNYSEFNGSWISKSDSYTMVISVKDNKNISIYNYYFIPSKNKYKQVENVEETVVKINNKKIFTKVYREANNHNVNVIYEIIEYNKMKATFVGDWTGVIYYTKK
jgi:hypothetical protein